MGLGGSGSKAQVAGACPNDLYPESRLPKVISDERPTVPPIKGRDDFAMPVRELLAKRVRHECSNPDCRRPTSGPQENPLKAINIGVAAHISAASPNGP